MLGVFLMQAAVEPPLRSGSSGWGKMPGLAQDIFAVVGVGLALFLVLVVWAMYFRKRRRHHHHREARVTYRVADEGATEAVDENGSGAHHRRHRRRRRSHRSRNPTLAETGGLPPPRTSDPTPPLA